MKLNLLNRDLFVHSDDKKARLASRVVTGIEAIFFVIAAFYFFNFIYILCDIIGSFVSGSPDVAIRDILRTLPITLSMMAVCHILTMIHSIHRNISLKVVNKVIFKNSITVIAHSALALLITLVNLIRGTYYSLVEGYPSPLFPLDGILMSLLCIALAVLCLVYLKKWQEKLPLNYTNRSETCKGVEKGFHHFGVSLWMLCALFGFAAFFMSFALVDWKHGYQFFSIMLVVMYILPFIYLLVWEFYFNELKKEAQKNFLFPSIVGLATSVVVIALFLIALGTNLDGPSNACMGIMPVDFTASVNASTLIYVLCNFLVPLVAFIKALNTNKKVK